MEVRLAELESVVDGLATLDPAFLADGESVVALHRLTERLAAVTTRAVAAFDNGREWEADGAQTAAAWVAATCRRPVDACRRRVRLGWMLREMPQTEEAWLAGEVG